MVHKAFPIALLICLMFFLHNLSMVAQEKSRYNALELRAIALAAESEQKNYFPEKANWIERVFDGFSFFIVYGLAGRDEFNKELKEKAVRLDSVFQQRQDVVLQREIIQSIEGMIFYFSMSEVSGMLTILVLFLYLLLDLLPSWPKKNAH